MLGVWVRVPIEEIGLHSCKRVGNPLLVESGTFTVSDVQQRLERVDKGTDTLTVMMLDSMTLMVGKLNSAHIKDID